MISTDYPSIVHIDAVNACSVDDGDDGVIVALRPLASAHWNMHKLSHRDAVQLADQLRLLTHTTD